MRSGLIVLSPADLRQHFCLLQRCEDFSVEEFIPELPVEAFDVTILPGTARFYEKSSDLESREPVPNGFGNELRSVVLSDEGWHPAQNEQVCQHIYDIYRVEPAVYTDCQTFTAVLIQNV